MPSALATNQNFRNLILAEPPESEEILREAWECVCKCAFPKGSAPTCSCPNYFSKSNNAVSLWLILDR